MDGNDLRPFIGSKTKEETKKRGCVYNVCICRVHVDVCVANNNIILPVYLRTFGSSVFRSMCADRIKANIFSMQVHADLRGTIVIGHIIIVYEMSCVLCPVYYCNHDETCRPTAASLTTYSSDGRPSLVPVVVAIHYNTVYILGTLLCTECI